MSREEFEKYLVDELKKIRAVYEKYCPEDPYLSMCINAGGSVYANNSYWEGWCKNKVDVYDGGEE